MRATQLARRMARVAVVEGGGWVKGFAPELYGAQRGNTLVVFALP